MARRVLPCGGVSKQPPSILVLARPGAVAEELFSDLAGRRDLIVLRADTVAAAAVALRDLPVSLVVTCNETPPDTIDALLAAIDRARPGVPVLAIRNRHSPERAAWRERGVGVLRLPIPRGVLRRSIDVVLEMNAASRRDGDTRGGR